MGPIVCATRGGEGSRRTQERAIALSRERGAPLIFLFVVDASFTQPNDPALAKVLADELERLGRGLLHIAQARAQKQGINAEAALRHGAVRQTIEDYLRAVNGDVLILGVPMIGSGKQTFSPGELPKFVEEIRANTGVEVIVVD